MKGIICEMRGGVLLHFRGSCHSLYARQHLVSVQTSGSENNTKQEDTEMHNLNRITFDPEVMQGQACIRQMRIPVSLIVNLVAHNKSPEKILEEYPTLEKEDIQEALEYAALLTRDEVHVG